MQIVIIIGVNIQTAGAFVAEATFEGAYDKQVADNHVPDTMRESFKNLIKAYEDYIFQSIIAD
ncbi:MAG: hypothetical protein NC318_07510 [Blautia sp.]|nr:hypothetical protein [Lachnoclostridium sp.]MCM1211435.1 hypothetical protein [Blautia sp.]